jgi:hypothetical protein
VLTGFHFHNSDQEGSNLGRKVGRFVVGRFFQALDCVAEGSTDVPHASSVEWRPSPKVSRGAMWISLAGIRKIGHWRRLTARVFEGRDSLRRAPEPRN